MEPEIHTISRGAPPSYAEAMGQAPPMKDNEYVPPSGRQTSCHPYPQMPSCPPSISGYQSQSNCYPTIGSPPYNPTRAPGTSAQQNPATPVQYYVDTAIVVHRKRLNDRCCKKVMAGLICLIVLIIAIKLIMVRSM